MRQDRQTNPNYRTNRHLLADHRNHRRYLLYPRDGYLLDIPHHQNHLIHPLHGSLLQTIKDPGQRSNQTWSRSPTTLMVTPMTSRGSSPNVTCTSPFLTSTSDTIPTKSFSAHRISARMPKYGGNYAHENWEGRHMGTRFTLPMSSLWKKSDVDSGRTPMPRSSSLNGRSSAKATLLMETCSSSSLKHSHSRQESSVST